MRTVAVTGGARRRCRLALTSHKTESTWVIFVSQGVSFSYRLTPGLFPSWGANPLLRHTSSRDRSATWFPGCIYRVLRMA